MFVNAQDEAAAMQNFGPRPGDEKLYVRFYMGARPNPGKSREQGHPVYDEVPYVVIRVPGDKNTVIDTVVDASHKARFAQQWEQFQRNQEQTQSGWSLREWPAMSRAMCEELGHLNITTVEQLAGLPDGFGARIMGFHEWKKKANAALEQAKDSATSERLAVENDELKATIAAQQKQLNELGAQVQKLLDGQGTPSKGR